MYDVVALGELLIDFTTQSANPDSCHLLSVGTFLYLRTKATPHNSTSSFDERFFAKPKFEKCRNTVCTRKGCAASVALRRP